MTMTKITFHAAAYSGTTRIPGDGDGPERATYEKAQSDCDALPKCYSHSVLASEDGAERQCYNSEDPYSDENC